MNKYLYAPLIWLMTTPVWSKNIIQVAEKVERNGSKFVVQLASIGLIITAISFVLGKQDASERLQKVIIGMILALCAGIIVSTIKTWV